MLIGLGEDKNPFDLGSLGQRSRSQGSLVKNVNMDTLIILRTIYHRTKNYISHADWS